MSGISNSKIVKTYCELLKQDNKILTGGEEYERWANELLHLSLKDRSILASGGLIVPQLGKKAGQLINLEYDNKKYKVDEKFLTHLSSLLGKNELRDPIIKQLDPGVDDVNKIVIVPIKYGFNKSIGYLWAIIENGNVMDLKNVLEFTSIIISLSIRAKKSSNTLSLMAKSFWEKLPYIDDVIVYAAETCLQALSCRAIVIWFLEDDYLRTKYTAGQECRMLSLDLDVGQGIAGQCARTGSIIIKDDLWEEPEVYHKIIIHEKNFRSAVFVPIDTGGGEVVGVFAAYAERPFAFSDLDLNIVSSITQWLCIKAAQQSLVDEVKNMQKRINKEMPLIEAGILAMGRVHDANNKLSFALNSLGYITEKYRYTDSKPSIYEDATKAADHIDDAKKIISALVRRSKLSKSNMRKQNIVEILEETINSFKSELQELNATVSLKGENTVKLILDKDLIARVFQNLFDNACYFLKRAPRKRKIDITVNKTIANVYLLFNDNGLGVPPYDIDKMFDVFYTTKGDRGMGFGLAITKKIIEDHGGTISVVSEWGSFTEFKIKLPLNIPS